MDTNSRRKAIGILVLFGAICFMLASWNETAAQVAPASGGRTSP